MNFNKMACVCSNSGSAQGAKRLLAAHYDFVDVNEADVIIALGGDGFVLHCLHKYLNLKKPIYGINRGTVGFLMNSFGEENLPQRIAAARTQKLFPLEMKAVTTDGKEHIGLAFNEVALIRKSQQAANLEIKIDGKVRLEKLVSDGILVATPAGSTAYNLSVHGPIIPLGSSILALTPISPFRPRRWRGALLPHDVSIELINKDPKKRPLSATADSLEVLNIASVTITERKDCCVNLLFDTHHSLEERIIREQFE
ncbi:MAG: NAD kinase [Gammaproteobacteria bacterium]|nr:NAD kinase [Gammaproteobacteria bacterium]